ncbi:M23 family metallopeptidase [Desulfosarcina sp. OttesenSCG-928-G10]|nr:M23 family metallopeptidase [Desulfosarcina sp. OttesenSCG-928-G10]
MFGSKKGLSGGRQFPVRLVLMIVGALLVAVPAVWLIIVRLEGTAPTVAFETDPAFIRAESTELTVILKDNRSGIRSLRVTISANGRDVDVLQREFPSGGLFVGGKEKSAQVAVPILPERLGLSDGSAVLRVEARDFSLRHWGKGTPGYLEKTIQIDTKPPSIQMLTRSTNVSQGGTGLVIYRLSEDCPKTGVSVGEDFYPGYGGYFADPRVHLAFFALDYRSGKGTPIRITAEDAAGNPSSVAMGAHIIAKTFRKDVINLSDGFLGAKMPDFYRYFPDLAKGDPLDLFLAINRDLRLRDDAAIAAAATAGTEKNILWEGVFLQLPNSASRAQFADHRTYFYNGKEVDQQNHMGTDLASIAHAPIPAANHGKVVFAGDQGIYGNAVVIDHGFGLFTLYSHMNEIHVGVGDAVQKGGIIGTTGATGMAGGDHLHYTTMVHHTFVNPLEWWDPAWIKNNITSKLESVSR